MDADQILGKYTEQLRIWKEATGKSNRELAALTSYFDFGDKRGSEGMPEATFSRVVRGVNEKRQRTLPARSDGIFNLYRLLGVYYLLNVIKSQEEVIKFLDKADLRKVPDSLTWEEIWQRIEEGAIRGQDKLEQTVTAESSINSHETGLAQRQTIFGDWIARRRFAIGIGLLMLLILVGLGSLVLKGATMQTALSASTIFFPVCQPSGSPAPSTFLSDQGFSLHEVAPDAATASILSNSIRSIGINSQGLWVGYAPTAAGIDGVSYLDPARGKWVHCSGLKLSAGQNVNAITFKNNAVFLAIDGGSDNFDAPGVAQLSNSGWRLYTRKDRLPSNVVYSVRTDASDTVWATTYEGVARLVEDHWEPVFHASPSAMACNDVYRFIDDIAGDRWFSLVKCGISQLTPSGQWDSYYTDTPGLKNARALVVDNKGGVWVVTDGGGVLRFFGGQWTVFTAPQVPSNHVQDVKQDKFGRIWIATDRGVAYTSDYGQTWIIHSTLNTLGIEFGCSGCAFDENHLWLILQDRGLGHVRIPPQQPTVKFVSVPSPVKLSPGDKYIFEVEVEILTEGFHKSDGDSLRSIEPDVAKLFGAWPTIEMNQDEVSPGQRYIFSNVKNPIVAPSTPGIYKIAWRVWQGRRFTSEPITIEFEVGDQ